MKNLLLTLTLLNLSIGTTYFARVTWERFKHPAGTAGGLTSGSMGSPWDSSFGAGYSPPPKLEVFKFPDQEVPAPEDHPPLQLMIGKHTWSIKYTSTRQLKAADSYAYENNETKSIWLSRDRAAIDAREDVVHEILHACFYEGKGTDEMLGHDENSFVQPTAPVLRDVLVDNPKLLVWIVKAGR